MCLLDDHLSASRRSEFRDFSRVLEALLHYEYHHVLENPKNGCAPLNPDSDTRTIKVLSQDARQNLQKHLNSFPQAPVLPG